MFPYDHRLIMVNAPSHSSNSTKWFMRIDNINHFSSPAQSPVIIIFLFMAPNGTNRHKKALYDIYILFPARYRPCVKLTGLDLVPAQEAPTSTDPNIAAQYRPWVALTKTYRLVPNKTVTMANLAQKTTFLGFWPNFGCQYLPKYWSKPKKSYRFGISIKFRVKWIQNSINLWNF